MHGCCSWHAVAPAAAPGKPASTRTCSAADHQRCCPARPRCWVLQDFATLQAMMEEIQANIALRQDTISLLTGEVGAGQEQGPDDCWPSALPPTWFW